MKRNSNRTSSAMRTRLALSVAAPLLLLSIASRGQTAPPVADAPSVPRAFAQAIEKAQARTVKIYGGKIGREPGYATGVIVSADGQIVTATSPLLSAEQIRVVLANGLHLNAQVVRRNNELSLALIKVDVPTPDHFDLSQATELRMGDWLLAVSNAFGVASGKEQLSVTLGVLSMRTALDARRGTQDFDYRGDALILDAITSNPGAAGGAVVSTSGALVGMLGRVIESRGTGTRVSYAVPRETLAKFVANKVEAPSPAPLAGPVDLGVRLFALSGARAAPYIDRVVAGSPAASAGLKPDDLVLDVNGQRVASVGDYNRIVRELPAGQVVILRVKRKNEIIEARLTLGPPTTGKAGGQTSS